ncbi:MAG: hypothetical protein OXQ92_13875 [Boseongicola sp.]|nr:hypothetical protein [Boseongicola sp.]MDD9976995.1 hypothetical protein [Boseongicola sp.]
MSDPLIYTLFILPFVVAAIVLVRAYARDELRNEMYLPKDKVDARKNRE